MISKARKILFSLMGAIYRGAGKTGLGKIPGAKSVYDLLLSHLWAAEPIIEIQGSKMYVNPKGLPQRFKKTFRPFVFQGVWEEMTTELFKKLVKEGDTVVDLGANMGYFSLLASRLVGEKGKVYAFEPEPVNYGLLVKNIELNGYDNIVPVPKAVSNVNGKVEFFIHSTDSGRHVIQDYNEKAENGNLIDAESVTLDEFFKDKSPPDVIKMDIEGAELLALLGMEKMIESSENLMIFTEFYPDLIKRAGFSVEDFAHKLLNEWHFSVEVLDDYAKHKKSWKVESISDLVNLAKNREISNLFLKKHG